MNAFCIVVPAAGKGVRMGNETPKQYLPLGGEPILERTLRRLLALQPKHLCLVVGEDDARWQSLPSASKCLIAIGGESRADSVLSGLSRLFGVQELDITDQTPVLVHDAVRPLFVVEDVMTLIDRVGGNQCGGLLATPVIDTLKRSDDNHVVVDTPDRSQFWQAQTPQLFQAGLLKRALLAAIDSGLVITDEASAIEAMGLRPMLIEASRHNIKITTPEDLAFAEYLLGASKCE
tara:strand:+ start:2018 stop:2719 length:702 start_codon:yes stop_codon:yes gene_type:complete